MSKTTLTDGSPVTPDHRDIDPATGLQKAYVVLSEEERAKGFVRPVREKYVHQKCGVVTVMVPATSVETFASPTASTFSAASNNLSASASERMRNSGSGDSTLCLQPAIVSAPRIKHAAIIIFLLIIQ